MKSCTYRPGHGGSEVHGELLCLFQERLDALLPFGKA